MDSGSHVFQFCLGVLAAVMALTALRSFIGSRFGRKAGHGEHE